MKLKPAGARVRLGDADARVDTKSGRALERAMKKEADRLADLQHLLYADGRYALLIVLQGRDASGKDGTIRHVFAHVDPQGCVVTSFGPPTTLEQRHDFLWRVHASVPPRGTVGIFNRSHYEEVLVPRVYGRIDKKECRRRFDQINDFERMLAANGTVILKFMLHVSKGEQRRRLQERLSDPTKNWKFQPGDLEDRERWREYTKAYKDMLEQTSTERAPWYVVPADDKPVRNWLVARTIADALADLDLRFPSADPAVLKRPIE
jgi:PPK2 family polyphosphate:nucleotide phosphotransferase